MIKTIIFDLGGVLIDLDMQRCFDRVKALGVDMDKLSESTTDDDSAEGATICEGVTAIGILHQYQVGRIPTQDFIEAIQKMSTPGTSYQQVLDAWNSCLLTIPQYKLDFVKELKDKGFAIYLLSNTNDAHWHYVEENVFSEPVSNYFIKTFLSQEMHMAKPSAEIYKSVLNQIGTPADECLFIDDSKANCDVAQSLGIHCFNTPVRYDFRDEVGQIIKRT